MSAPATPPEPVVPGCIARPCFLLCPPMLGRHPAAPSASPADRRLLQFLELYNFIAADALVYLLPAAAPHGVLAVAELGFVPDHLPGRGVAVVAPGAEALFRSLGYRVEPAPDQLHGEASVRHLHGHTYLGGYANAAERQALDAVAAAFDMAIIPVRTAMAGVRRLDRLAFPLTAEDTLVCTDLLDRQELAQVERVTNVLNVSEQAARAGICASVRFHTLVLNASDIHDRRAGSEGYAEERGKNRRLEDICAERGFEPALFNLSEYRRDGLFLSDLLLHLNRHSYTFRLV